MLTIVAYWVGMSIITFCDGAFHLVTTVFGWVQGFGIRLVRMAHANGYDPAAAVKKLESAEASPEPAPVLKTA